MPTFLDYRSLPYTYPEPNPNRRHRRSNRQREALAGILRLAHRRNNGSRVVRVRRAGTSRSTAFGGNGGPTMQRLNSESASHFGGLTEFPWQIPGGGNGGIFCSIANNLGSDPNTIYAATDFPPHWGPAAGFGPMSLLPKGVSEQVCAVMPRGETHYQEGDGDCGLVLPSDYQSVGMTFDCLFLKSAGAESIVNWAWQHHSSRLINVAVDHQAGTFDGTKLQLSQTPAIPQPYIFTTPVLTFGADTCGSLGISGQATSYPTNNIATIFLGWKPKYAGAKQYGLLWENWSEGGYQPANHYGLTGQKPIAAAMGRPDIWCLEIDINWFYSSKTAANFYEELKTLMLYLRSIADVPFIYDYQPGIERAAPGQTINDTEFDQCFGVIARLVDEGWMALGFNSRLIAEETLGYTREQQQALRYIVKTYSAGATYAVDDFYLWTDSVYYACVSPAAAGENPTTAAAKWRDMRHALGVAYALNDVILTMSGAQITEARICVEPHTSAIANDRLPHNPRYWRRLDLYKFDDAITPAGNGRVHFQNKAQTQLAKITVDQLVAATLGGPGGGT